MKIRRLAVAIVITALLFTVLTPRRAAASFTDGLIIGGIIAGAVVVVSVVVGLIAAAGSSDEPHFLTESDANPQNAPMSRQRDQVRFGLQCPVSADGRALVCW